jgi:hypothetical protein
MGGGRAGYWDGTMTVVAGAVYAGAAGAVGSAAGGV